MKVIIFAKTISVNLAVENKVINVITIFENSSGNENHDKSIMEEMVTEAETELVPVIVQEVTSVVPVVDK